MSFVLDNMSTSEEEEPFVADSDNDPEFSPEQDDHGRKRRRTIKDFFTRSKSTQLNLQEIDSEASTSSSPSQFQNLQNKKSKSALFDGTFFSIQNIVNENIEAKCILCEPKKVLIKGKISATSNFLKHLKIKHEGSIEKYQNHRKKVKENTLIGEKEKKRENTSKQKQQTLLDIQRKKTVTQKEFDDKLTFFFACTMIPLSIIENDSFKDLFSGTGFSLMSRRNLVRKIDVEYVDYNKIIATVTDNGSNFVKAFQEYGIKITDFKENINNPDSSDSENEDLNFNIISNTDDDNVILPKHYRCASHTLNLLATTDVNKAIDSNAALKNKHTKAFHKCNLLWKKSGLPKSAEIIQNTLGHTLSYPVKTRWNSFYNSVSQIICVKDKIPELVTKLDIKDSFKEAEIQYLEDYIKILKPIAETLNFLQGEHKTMYGYLLPSILSLKIKLDKIIQAETQNTTVNIITKFVLNGLKERFSYLFTINEKSKDPIIAAVLIPSIKLRWLNVLKDTDPSANFKNIVDMIINETKNLCNFPSDTYTPEDTPVSLETDFFDFEDSVTDSEAQAQRIQVTTDQNRKSPKLELELLQYLEDKRCMTEMLNDYSTIKQIYQKYNAPLPSSAPVERLFSFASYINAPRRNALSEDLFEKLVFLKGNSNFHP